MADCFLVRRGSNVQPKDLMPVPIGLTLFFDYRNGVDVTNRTWKDRVNGVICTASGNFNSNENYLEMNGYVFPLSYDEGLGAYTIYSIVCAKEYNSNWTSFISEYGTAPQFNICNHDGKLSIGSGYHSGAYTGDINSYGEWHVCCITLDEKFGIFYIDGERKYSYDGYTIPKFTSDNPLYFGYGNMKMMAVCPNVAHSQKVVVENSQYLISKYIE